MKTTLRSLVALIILFAALLLSSCEDDDAPVAENDQAKKEQVNKILALREDLNFVNRFVDETFAGGSFEGGRASVTRTIIARLNESAPCAEPTEEEWTNGSTKVTLDFGTGCQTEDGIEVAGKVVMIFSFIENTFEFSLEFIDYSEKSGDNKDEVANGTVEGSFLIDLEAGEFVQEMEQDLTITYPGNIEARLVMAQEAVMTEDGLRVASMSTSGNFGDGGAFSVTVTKALLFDFSCESDLPVEGEEVVTFQGNTIRVNYGNGTCDDSYSVN